MADTLARRSVAGSLFAAFCLGLCSVSALGQETPHTPHLSGFFQPAMGSPIAPDEGGFLRRWLLLEPIVNDVVRATEPLRWHALDSKLWDVKLFNFAQALDKAK